MSAAPFIERELLPYHSKPVSDYTHASALLKHTHAHIIAAITHVHTVKAMWYSELSDRTNSSFYVCLSYCVAEGSGLPFRITTEALSS